MVNAMFGKLATKTRPLRNAILCFCCVLIACSIPISIIVHQQTKNEQHSMDQLLMERTLAIKTVLGKLLYKNYALAAWVIQNDGNTANFHAIAASLMDDPAISAVALAPGGVVQTVHPSAGNEKFVGYNLFGDGSGNEEARQAKESDDLFLAGPFPRMQGGGMALAGRLPVYLYTNEGTRYFWGLVTIALKYPDALNGTGLETLRGLKLGHMLWRDNPDTRHRQIISHNIAPNEKNAAFIEKRIKVLNADWFLRIFPARQWYTIPGNWFLIGTGLGLSLLAACIVFKNGVLREMKETLATVTHTDTLTGLLNRTGLFLVLDKLIDHGEEFHLAYIDLDYFKQINDTYGHSVGDFTLREFTRRIQSWLGENHLLARIGGDEFVLLRFANTSFPHYIWDRINHELKRPFSPGTCGDFHLSFSCGAAAYPIDGETADEMIACADRRMYIEKHRRYHVEKRRRLADWVEAC